MFNKSCHFGIVCNLHTRLYIILFSRIIRISRLKYFHLQFMININNIGLDETNWTEHQKIKTFMLSVDHNTQRK